MLFRSEISADSDVTQTDSALAHRLRFDKRASAHSMNDSGFNQTPNVKAQLRRKASAEATGWAV